MSIEAIRAFTGHGAAMSPGVPPRGLRRWAWLAVGLAAWCLVWVGAAIDAQAAEPKRAPTAGATDVVGPSVQLRVVGGLANGRKYREFEEPFWTRTAREITGGRISASIVPFDQAGVPAHDMLRLVQTGVVPIGTVLASRSAALDPELVAMDLPGMNLDGASLRRNAAVYRPHLVRVLRERYGVRLLALYTYPPQVMFCNRPFVGLSSIEGLRVRVSDGPQAELVKTLSGQPVHTEFADIVRAARAGSIDCAITSATGGNLLGLHEVMTHIDRSAVSWAMVLLVAHEGAWSALPPGTAESLQRGLTELEKTMWDDSEAEASLGVACNVGAASCASGRRGKMIEVPPNIADETRLRALLTSQILPGWAKRCGAECVTAWNQTLRTTTGITLKLP
jgi:TRAP-type C4-dicarboxylate transport system substrate-binding protein